MILIGNGPVITRDKIHPFYKNGAVIVENDKIKEVGEYQKLKEKYSSAQLIDAKGKVIMPGFLDTHEHIYSAFARGSRLPFSPPQNFLQVLEGTWWKLDSNLLLENTFYSAIMTYLECIRNGITFVSDHHASYKAVKGSLFEIARAAKLLSIRTCLAYEISDREGKEKRNAAIEENMEFLDFLKNNPSNMQKGMVGLHASFTLSDETLKLCQKENKYEAGYHVHIAEGEYDEIHCQENYGTSVVKRLSEYGILNKKSVAGHCIHISEEDRKLLKRNGIMVVHNPESNMGNAVGAPDVFALLEEGIVTGLGTDGYTHDMLESLKVANILQKHQHKMPDRGFLEACTLLFENNAKIGTSIVGETVGELKQGALADIIIMDYIPATPMNENNLDGHIMFGMSGAMTDTTMVNGKVLMQNKTMIEIDEQELKRQCRESAKELWSRLEK